MPHRLREVLGIVADLVGVIGFVILVWGAIGKQLVPLLTQLPVSNVLLMVVGALLIAVDILVRLSRRSEAPTEGLSGDHRPAIAPAIPVALAPRPDPGPEPATESEPEPRIIVDRTPEELTAHFKGVTYVQGEDRIARYLGKWMRVSGPVANVGLISPNLAVVTFADRSIFDANRVRMLFRDKRWIERVVLLSPGDKLAGIGKIAEIDALSVRLDDCEIEG